MNTSELGAALARIDLLISRAAAGIDLGWDDQTTDLVLDAVVIAVAASAACPPVGVVALTEAERQLDVRECLDAAWRTLEEIPLEVLVDVPGAARLRTVIPDARRTYALETQQQA